MAATAMAQSDAISRVDSGPFMESGRPGAVPAQGALPPTTLGNAAAQVAAGGQTIPPGATKAKLMGVIAVGAVVVLGVGAGVYFATRPGKKPKEKKEDKVAETRSPPPMEEVPPMPAAPVVVPRKNLKLFKILVRSRTKKVRVEVNIAGQASFTKRPPFKLEVKEGERISLRARRPGFEDGVETFVAMKNRRVSFKLKRARRGSRPRPVVELPRPRPMAEPPRPRPRPARMGPRRAGEGTLKPMF
jgi:hypothetical protein